LANSISFFILRLGLCLPSFRTFFFFFPLPNGDPGLLVKTLCMSEGRPLYLLCYSVVPEFLPSPGNNWCSVASELQILLGIHKRMTLSYRSPQIFLQRPKITAVIFSIFEFFRDKRENKAEAGKVGGCEQQPIQPSFLASHIRPSVPSHQKEVSHCPQPWSLAASLYW
jgi:hypothetical protein